MRSCSPCRWSLILLLAVAMALFQHNALAQECELNCQTNNCSPEGQCICELPSPDSAMTGNRTFRGGVFCDVESVMCNGTNSFWCEHSGICNEGENYTCTCPTGFAGVHCNFAGLKCGDIYCYNTDACQVEEISEISSCNCPPEFLGSADCSVATALSVQSPTAIPQMAGNDADDDKEADRNHNGKGFGLSLGIVVAILLSISCLCGLVLRCHSRRVSKSRFHELRQVQMNDGLDFFDDGEDDPFADPRTFGKRSGKGFA